MAAYGLQGRRARHLLDVGCGEGFLARHLRLHAERISLVDISAAAVERARARVEVAGEDHVGDALTVLRGLPSGEYDAIVISELLYWLMSDTSGEAVQAVFEQLFTDHGLPRVPAAVYRPTGPVLPRARHGPHGLLRS